MRWLNVRAAVRICRVVARESTTGVRVQPAMGAGGILQGGTGQTRVRMGKERRKRKEGRERKRGHGDKIYQIGQHTAMDIWILYYEGNGGNGGNGEETAGSLCRYTVGMMYLSGKCCT